MVFKNFLLRLIHCTDHYWWIWKGSLSSGLQNFLIKKFSNFLTCQFWILFFSAWHFAEGIQFQILFFPHGISPSFFHPFSLSIFTFQFSEKRCRPNVNSRALKPGRYIQSSENLYRWHSFFLKLQISSFKFRFFLFFFFVMNRTDKFLIFECMCNSDIDIFFPHDICLDWGLKTWTHSSFFHPFFPFEICCISIGKLIYNRDLFCPMPAWHLLEIEGLKIRTQWAWNLYLISLENLFSTLFSFSILPFNRLKPNAWK